MVRTLAHDLAVLSRAIFDAGPAYCHALIHPADAFGVIGGFGASLGAFATGVFVVRRADQHEMD
jgi:hypothetical protein